MNGNLGYTQYAEKPHHTDTTHQLYKVKCTFQNLYCLERKPYSVTDAIWAVTNEKGSILRLQDQNDTCVMQAKSIAFLWICPCVLQGTVAYKSIHILHKIQTVQNVCI